MGKTAIFVLATLQQLEPVQGEVSCVVMCHTRELAFQIKNEYARFSKYLPDVKTAVFFGGVAIQENIDLLKNKEKSPNIIVATPGRLNALVRDKVLRLGSVKQFVLDECDKMLDQVGKSAPRSSVAASIADPGPRHATRRPRDLPRHPSPEAGHDVFSHAR